MPPIGDMAWAASPIASSPGRCQHVSRSSATVSSCRSAISSSSLSVEIGRSLGDFLADRVDAPARDSLGRALGNQEGALPVVAAVDHHQQAPPLDISAVVRRFRRATLATRNQKTSIGAPRYSTGSSRADDRRAAVGGDRQRSRGAPLRFRVRTPTTLPCSSMNRRPALPSGGGNPGTLCASSRRKSRKSHCGIIAMNGAGVFRCDKSPIVHSPACDPQFGANSARCAAARGTARASRAGSGSPSSKGEPCRPGNRGRSLACFSSTSTCTPARANRSPAIIPAGPPPTTIRSSAGASFDVMTSLSAARPQVTSRSSAA